MHPFSVVQVYVSSIEVVSILPSRKTVEFGVPDGSGSTAASAVFETAQNHPYPHLPPPPAACAAIITSMCQVFALGFFFLFS